ncbi:wax ester/triacylglycerol synthase family O-acyltransferase [Iamia sp.]|uniref:WS/DGAT/MGAT family O-acyltransferase n=1 Tax=Iamia sp. TaxID=2722710 RepID=UPI002BB9E58D|nr:wax ester/triacylglycerol synthase family O-acyltransferase [Iamia sp.]HXH57406.1 wax ester/triacylglycerol synthase family O-acyltransferase [Iamia sp.]
MSYDRLSPQDSVFLHIEDDHQPLHVGALAYFEAGPLLGADGRFDLARVRRRIESRLHLVPRFRKRIMKVPFDQGRPVWVDDEGFDLAYHVRLTAIPAPGSEAQLKLLMDRIQAQLLDRLRPLWEIWFVEGVENDRVALIQKTHHALVDGVSGVDVATVLLDLEANVVDTDPEPWTPEPAPDSATLLVDSLVERTVEPTELLRSARAALRVPQHAAERIGQVARTVVDLARSTPSAPWNVPVTPHRRFEPVRIALDRAKDLRRAAAARGDDLASTTLNDVVLTACAGAMRTYLLERGDDVPDELVYRAMVPVSVRDVSQQMALGNRVSMMTADLPVGEPDPVERLRFIHAHMASRKDMGQAVGADALMELTGYAPPTLLALGSRLAVRAMPLNTVITNIPGPQLPLYCLGSRMLEAFPYVCVVDGMAMIMAVISYDGHLAFGLSGDRSAVPDLHVLAEGVETAFEDLEHGLGIVAAPETSLARKAPATNAAAPKAPTKKAVPRKDPSRTGPAKRAAAKRTAAKKAGARRAPASKAPARKAPAKKAPAKKAPARRAAAKKAPAKKAPARKAPARKAPARSAAARKAPTTKAPARKAPASKAATKKAAIRKSPARKAPARKAAS